MIQTFRLTTDESNSPHIRAMLERVAARVGGDADEIKSRTMVFGTSPAAASLSIKSAGGTEEVEGIATTDDVDMDGEVILQDGIDWSLMEGRGAYKTLYVDHMWSAATAIAKFRFAKRVSMPGGKTATIIRAAFLPDEYSEHVRQVKQLVRSGMCGLSITTLYAKKDYRPPAKENERYQGARGIITKSRVVEVSFTSMPVNVACSTWMASADSDTLARAASFGRTGGVPRSFLELAKRARRPRRIVVV